MKKFRGSLIKVGVPNINRNVYSREAVMGMDLSKTPERITAAWFEDGKLMCVKDLTEEEAVRLYGDSFPRVSCGYSKTDID